MHIIKYRSSPSMATLCMCPNCALVYGSGDAAFPTRLANANAFVRIELRESESVIALGTNLAFDNDKTLFLHYKPNCAVLDYLKGAADDDAVVVGAVAIGSAIHIKDDSAGVAIGYAAASTDKLAGSLVDQVQGTLDN